MLTKQCIGIILGVIPVVSSYFFTNCNVLDYFAISILKKITITFQNSGIRCKYEPRNEDREFKLNLVKKGIDTMIFNFKVV